MGETFSQRLRECIERQWLTQKELAARANITDVALSRYVNGTRIPKANTLSRLLEPLHTTADYLINGTPPGGESEIEKKIKLVEKNAARMTKAEKMKIISILLD